MSSTIPPGYKLVPENDWTGFNPEARAKAAAFDTWMARGGEPVNGRFADGPMKGLTYDQAKLRFEAMWSSAPDALKEKYAGRGKNDLAPSERPQGPVKGQTEKRMEFYANQKNNRMAFYGQTPATPAPRPRQKPPMVGPPKPQATPSAPAGDLSKEAMGTPDQQAAIRGMVEGSADLATADAGGSAAMAATIADWKRQKAVEHLRQQGEITSAEAEAVRAAAEEKHRQEVAKRRDEITRSRRAEVDALRSDAGVAPKYHSPASPTGAGHYAPQYDRIAASLSADEMRSGGDAAAQAPITPPAPYRIGTPARINSLTGLPMGYQPGDATQGLDKAAVAGSDQRVKDAQEASAIAQRNRPQLMTPATPAPAPQRYQQAQSEYQSSQLDPAKAQQMDTIYAGANSRDQAQITANSLKRAAGLQAMARPEPPRPFAPRSLPARRQPPPQIIPAIRRPPYSSHFR